MSFFIVDVEADGPIPHKYSMVSFGAVKLSTSLDLSFYGKVKPISDLWVPESLAVSGVSREEHLNFDDPKNTMLSFKEWIQSNSNDRPIFVSDNLAFDWQWINYYFHYFLGENPFGFSGRRIGDIYSGFQKNLFSSSKWKKHRIQTHTHNPVDDAKGNAEALLYILNQNHIRIPK